MPNTTGSKQLDIPRSFKAQEEAQKTLNQEELFLQLKPDADPIAAWALVC